MAETDLDSIGERIARLFNSGKVALAEKDVKRLNRVRDDVWQIQMELFPFVVEEDLTAEGLRAAILLAQVARVSLNLQSASENWLYALSSCAKLIVASAHILSGYHNNMFTTPEIALLAVVRDISREVAAGAAYVAHQSGNPAAAIMSLEAVTSVTMGIRMKRAAVKVVEQRMASGLTTAQDMMYYHRSINDVPDGVGLRQYVNDNLAHPENILSMGKAFDFRSLSDKPLFSPRVDSGSSDALQQFFLTSPEAHCVRAIRSSGRALVYVVPGYGINPGVAIRVSANGPQTCSVDSIWLPKLRNNELSFELEKVRDALRQPGSGKSLDEVCAILGWTGANVWGPISTEWPDLRATALAVVPIGIAGLLPIYSATVHGSPVCTVWDITVAPSARALHFSAIQEPPTLADTFVAADSWYGDYCIPHASTEAARIAAIHNTSPVVYGAAMQSGAGPDEPRKLRAFRGHAPQSTNGIHRDIAKRLRTASIIHLACHGKMEEDGPYLFLGRQAVPLSSLVDTEETQLSGHPLVVLSACELGGFNADDFSNEQFGFPAGLIAMGARSVIGALWPVPDEDTAKFMEDFHHHLKEFPSNKALPQAIADAQRQQISALTWGSFVHFGV